MGCLIPTTTWSIFWISSPQNVSLPTYLQGSPRHYNYSGNPKPQTIWMGFLDQTPSPFLIFSLPSQSTQKLSGSFYDMSIEPFPSYPKCHSTWSLKWGKRDCREIIHASNGEGETFYPAIYLRSCRKSCIHDLGWSLLAGATGKVKQCMRHRRQACRTKCSYDTSTSANIHPFLL